MQRSQFPGPDAGCAEAELVALGAGESAASGPTDLSLAQTDYDHGLQFRADVPTNISASGAEQAEWLPEFQRLHLDSRKTVPDYGQRHPFSSTQGVGTTNWHDEFVRQQHALVPQQQQQYGRFPSFPATTNFPLTTARGLDSTRLLHNRDQLTTSESTTVDNETAAFETAFNQAQADAESHGIRTASAAPRSTVSQLQPSLGQTDENGQKRSSEVSPGSPRIGLDATQQERTSRNLSAPSDDDLSRTAGHVVQAVADNKSPRFEESSFFSLMRQLRDKEVFVDGDGMKNVSFPVRPLASL